MEKNKIIIKGSDFSYDSKGDIKKSKPKKLSEVISLSVKGKKYNSLEDVFKDVTKKLRDKPGE